MKAVLQSGEAAISYELVGIGPAVALLHEGICDSRMWDSQVGPLVESGYSVLRYDLRGFGSSTLPPGPFVHADDLRALLDALGIETAALVGASLGGRIALEFALIHPARVSKLALVGAALRDWRWSDAVNRFGEEEDALLERGDVDGAVEVNLRTWVDGPERAPEEVDQRVRENVAEMQRLAFDVQLAAVAAGDPGPEEPLDPPASMRLSEVSAPTLILTGEQDQPDILEIARRFAAEIPHARLAVVARTAHVPMMERPDDFNRLLLEFLGER
jgi:pimeloyl-ACP methyl ester carboxylesterase